MPGLDQGCGTLLAISTSAACWTRRWSCAWARWAARRSANAQWGRGHWSTLFPAVLAGGGIRGGVAYGRSDKDAALPVEHPTSPEDLAATIYHALGIDPELRVPDPQGRPVPLVDGGRPLLELFG